MTIQDQADGKLAILSRPMDTRPKMLNFAWFVVNIFSAAFFIHRAMYEEKTGLMAFFIVLAIVFFIVAFRFINKAAMSEQLFVGSGELRVIIKSFITKTHVFDLVEISNFRHLPKPESTRPTDAG